MKYLYKTLLIVAVYFASLNFASAQQWLKNADFTHLNRPVTLFDIEKAFNDYYKDKPEPKDEEGLEKDGERQIFHRLDYFMRQRTFPSGQLFDPAIIVKEYNNYKSTHQAKNLAYVADWTLLGPSQIPTSVSGNQGGAGRIDCIRFHPTDTNTFWIGAACGGLWKTSDGGNTWSTNTDLMPAIGVSDIAINPLNPDTMYLATGDRYGYFAVGAFWGGTYSCGVMKSTDGGVTWNTTGLSFLQSQNILVQKIAISPSNSNIIVAATSNGIYRSTDAGANWTNVQAGYFYDLRYKTNNANIIFAGSDTNTYKSINGGATWTSLNNNIGTGGRMSLAVSPANPQVIYALCQTGNGTLFSSTDGGTTWNNMSVPPANFYGFYDLVLTCSPTDANVVYVGGGGSNQDIQKSTDGGSTWSAPIANYIHVDNHDIEPAPNSGTTVYCTNDGGVFRSYDGGVTWTDLSNGLAIAQFYRLGCSVTNPNLVYCGQQDNGCVKSLATSFYSVIGADGMECLVDYTNENTAYTSSQYGGISRTNDGGLSFVGAAPNNGSGDWVTPYVIDPVDHNTLYCGYSDGNGMGVVFKSTDQGNSWDSISASLDPSVINVLAISRSNNNHIYAGNMGALYKTTNGGTTWNSISAGLPLNSAGILYMAVNDTNPNSIWVALGGYSAGNKVYQSYDGGNTWTNISGTLPNVPVNCIVCQRNSADELYIGTDFGVFYKNASMNDWAAYDDGLPHVICDELEIQYGVSKLRVATYGRGLWQSDLITSTLVPLDASLSTITSPSGNSCDSTINPVVTIENWGTSTLTSLNIVYFIDSNTPLTYNWSGSLANQATATVNLPAMNASFGAHTFTAYTTNPNGSSDQNNANDTSHSSFTIITQAQVIAPLIEGFESSVFPPNLWTVTSGWERDSTVGGFGNSASSALMPFYSDPSNGYLYSPFIDLTQMNTPIKISFNVAYSRYDAQYSDTLILAVSSDCGMTWTTLWEKGGDTLATAPDDNSNEFVPTSAQWRNELIDITSYAGQSKIQFLFEGLSGYGNDCYLDDINIFNSAGIPTVSNDNKVIVYPNPATGVFNVLVYGAQSNNTTLTIYDALGQVVQQSNQKINAGVNQFAINLSGKSIGIYHLKIETDKEVINKTLNLIK